MAQVAVIGLGRFGFHVAKHLHQSGHEVLAIDIDPQNVRAIADFSSRAVVLDARDKERVDALGIRDFDVVVVSLGERIDASASIRSTTASSSSPWPPPRRPATTASSRSACPPSTGGTCRAAATT